MGPFLENCLNLYKSLLQILGDGVVYLIVFLRLDQSGIEPPSGRHPNSLFNIEFLVFLVFTLKMLLDIH